MTNNGKPLVTIIDHTDAERARVATVREDGHWAILRKGPTFTTVGRTATTYENGTLVGCERQQLTVFSDGRILFYFHDDTAALWGGILDFIPTRWERLRDTDSILTVVSQPARTDHIEY